MFRCFKKLIFFLLLFIFGSSAIHSQVVVSGSVISAEGQALIGANIVLEGTQIGTISDLEGKYEFTISEQGTFALTASYTGLRTTTHSIVIDTDPIHVDFELASDPLSLGDVIITGTFNKQSRLASSIASSTMNSEAIASKNALGTAELLSHIPGAFVDASAGSIFTRVYSRGISSSAEEDIGWYYMSLQEDELPITNYQTTYYGPDLFHRVDLTTSRLEAVRGGSTMITNTNAPGGVFNFISKTGGDSFRGRMTITGALQGENNMLGRYDVNIGGPLSANGWSYNLGGFYRYDEGARNTDINWENGGQLKVNLIKKYKNGYIKVYGKYLDDKVNRYQGLAATNWEDPQPAFGHDFNHTALNLPKLTTYIPDGRLGQDNVGESYTYKTDDGIKTKDMALGFKISHSFKGWNISSNFKYSDKSADWNSTIANQPLGLEGFFPYLLSGIDPTFQNIPLGNIVFRDARTDELVASINNFGILGPFQGQPASFEYLEGSLPNDAVMGIAPWKKMDEATEFMEELKVDKQLGQHSLTGGIFYALSEIESFTSASFAYATYENEPRMLRVSLENPGSPVVKLSDDAGISNHGGLLYNRGSATINQLAFFLNDNFDVNDKFNIDAGLRYDIIGHEGNKDRSAPPIFNGGLDLDENTAYDNSTLLATRMDAFDYEYKYLSWSLGLNYLLSDDMAVFARVSNGHKAPEMNYYFNNFDGVPIDRKGTEQDIFQGELGMKIINPKYSLFATAFYSRLDNIAFSEFVLDQEDGSIFFTPIQLNKTTTIGLELESNISIANGFDLGMKATLQNPEATRFNIYNANETVDQADDEVDDYSGNKIPHNPSIMFDITPSYTQDKLGVFASLRYMGERKGNVSNAFVLPGFATLNAGISYQLNKNIDISLAANNLLNSTGLMNFFGPNEFGSNSNAATEEYIQNNPDASFVVFPINPRSIFLKIGYNM